MAVVRILNVNIAPYVYLNMCFNKFSFKKATEIFSLLIIRRDT